jgi:SAM-dependent methyltransferase
MSRRNDRRRAWAKPDAREVQERLQATVDRLLADREAPRVLEAGCGSSSNVRFPSSRCLVGIDISQHQLDKNTLLDEKILGDIQAYEFPEESFDAVVCWNVLEHVEHPEVAVRNFCAALRPEGILIIACPHPRSFEGLVARLTPHRFHVWFYKWVLGVKDAGTAKDPRPFPTVMSPQIAPEAMSSLAESCGLSAELRAVSTGTQWGSQRFVVRRVIRPAVLGLALFARLVSLGKYRGELCETRLVFRKTGVAA